MSTHQQGHVSPSFLSTSLIPFSRKKKLFHLLDLALPLFFPLPHTPTLEASFTCFETHLNDHRSHGDAAGPPPCGLQSSKNQYQSSSLPGLVEEKILRGIRILMRSVLSESPREWNHEQISFGGQGDNLKWPHPSPPG